MHRKSYRKLSTFSLIVGASGLLGLLAGCPVPPDCTSDGDCDDALFCNGVEVCDDGACLSNGDPCPADETCDEDNDVCILPCETDADCDDADACTDDACNGDGECHHTNSAAACDDGLFCNGAEACTIPEGETKGICAAGANPCEGDEICLEDADECRPLGIVFSDDFEAGQGRWSVDNGAWEVGVPSSGPSSTSSGEQLAATVLARNYPQNDSRLLSPSIQLPVIGAEDEVELRFCHWFAFAVSASATHSGVVQIREQAASGEWETWASLKSFVGSSGVFTNTLVDLSAYAGKKVQVGFLLNGGGNANTTAGWYVDDVTIEVF